MFFRMVIAVTTASLLVSCTNYRNLRQMRSSEVGLGLSIPESMRELPVCTDSVADEVAVADDDGPIIMNAVKDTETGEMVATDVIRPSSVTARFRNVAERGGYVSLGFDIMVPQQMAGSEWKLRIDPVLNVKEETVRLDPVFITGDRYRRAQMRGYEKYKAFLESIITDSSEFVMRRQLDVFMKRHFPDTYAMKNDSSFVTGPDEENLFGVKQREALEHYTRRLLQRRNDRKRNNLGKMYSKYVKDPLLREGVRLDTVMNVEGTFVYRYVHRFKSIPGLRKVTVSLDGSLYERGKKILSLPISDGLTFYISSMAALADEYVRYRTVIKERKVFDNTMAFVDFAQGSASVDTSIGQNASELFRIRKCIDDVMSRKELVLDSLIVLASCSLEGDLETNKSLSAARTLAMGRYIREYIPDRWRNVIKTRTVSEDWERFRLLVGNDTVLPAEAVRHILDIACQRKGADAREYELSRLPQYRYLREKIYPRLRTVRFDFYLHREGQVKDTVYMTEIDTVYMGGLAALREHDYVKAVEILRPYHDYNSALALATAGYDHSCLEVLMSLDADNPKVSYLKSIILSRLRKYDDALQEFSRAVMMEPSLIHRANLDPELEVVRERFNNFK